MESICSAGSLTWDQPAVPRHIDEYRRGGLGYVCDFGSPDLPLSHRQAEINLQTATLEDRAAVQEQTSKLEKKPLASRLAVFQKPRLLKHPSSTNPHTTI